MHSKVIITSLIFGLAVSLAPVVVSTVGANAKKDACDVVEPASQALRAPQPKQAVAASTTVRPDLFITRSRSGSLNSGGANWYTFTAPFDGRFWFQSSTTNMDPIAEIYLGLGTNYGTVSPDDGNRDDISSSDRNFRFALDMTCGQTRYIRVRDYYNRAGSYTIAASHNHVYDDRTAYYSSTKHREFCSCGENHLVDLNVDDELSGHGRDMVHCSICDRWITLTPSGHTHSYSWCSYRDQNTHRRICECGYNYSTSHTFDAVYNVGDYQVKHCSGCNAWVEVYSPHVHSYTSSYETYNNAMHRAVCSCGNSILQQHTFNDYIEIGHGHNGMIRCSKCDAYIEPDILTLDNSSSGSIATNDAKWHVFKAENTGSYTFRLTGSTSYTYMEFYLGNYPTSMTTSFTTENIGVVSHTRTVSDNQWVFIRVRGNNWSATNYTLSVSPAHTHAYNQIVDYGDSQNHKLVCSCGASITQAHAYNSCVSNNDAFHTMACACGRASTNEHTFNSFAPYGHGHNDMIHCSTCNNNIECYPLNENDYSHSISSGDVKWYFFEATDPGTYTFETTGSYDTYGDLYVGNFPTTLTDSDDDAGEGYNFKLSCELDIGDRAFVRVRECDWEYAEYTITVTREEPPAPATGWTILLYMDGVTADEQLCEIESITEQKPNDVHILVETNISHRTNTEDGYLHRYTFQNGHFEDYGGYDGRITRKNMGLENTFRDFLYLGVEEFLNDHMGLILYNHGRGIQGVCFDSYGMPAGQEDSLTSSEIASACEQVFEDNNIDKFDFIGYDACVMQVQDIAEFNSPYFDYQIASEEEEAAVMGWAYDQWMDDLFRHASIEDMMIEMCDGMVNAGCNCETSWGLNLTALDLRKMNAYKNKFEQLASAMYTAVNANREEFYGIVEATYQFGVNASSTKPEHGKGYGNCDCGIFLDRLEQSDVFCVFGSLINEVRAAYSELVFHCAGYGYNGGSNPASGVSIQHLLYPEYHIYPVEETHFYNWRSLFNAQLDVK